MCYVIAGAHAPAYVYLYPVVFSSFLLGKLMPHCVRAGGFNEIVYFSLIDELFKVNQAGDII